MASLHFSLPPFLSFCPKAGSFPKLLLNVHPKPAENLAQGSSEQGRYFCYEACLLTKSWMARSTVGPGGPERLLSCNPDYHNTITIHTWHRVATHFWSCSHKTMDFLSLQSLCVLHRAWHGAGPGQLQKSVSSPLSPPLLSVLSGCHSFFSSPLHRPLYAALKAAHVQTLLGKAP